MIPKPDRILVKWNHIGQSHYCQLYRSYLRNWYLTKECALLSFLILHKLLIQYETEAYFINWSQFFPIISTLLNKSIFSCQTWRLILRTEVDQGWCPTGMCIGVSYIYLILMTCQLLWTIPWPCLQTIQPAVMTIGETVENSIRKLQSAVNKFTTWK
jgi:hypothetical protein